MNAPEPEEKRMRRNQLVGRVLIVALGLLVAAYVVVTFWR